MTHDHDALPPTPHGTLGSATNTHDGSVGDDANGELSAGATLGDERDERDERDDGFELALFALLEQASATPYLPIHSAGVAQESSQATAETAGQPAQVWGVDMPPGLLGALAAAQAHGGQRLADALLLTVTEDRRDALLDALLDRANEQPQEQPDTATDTHRNPHGGYPASAPSAPSALVPAVAPAEVGGASAGRLSPGAQRALAHIFGVAKTGDGSAYTQRGAPPARKVAETGGAYQPHGERSTPPSSDET